MAVGLQASLYWRLSGFYFFYFIVLGTLVPYLPLYLQGQGFSAWQIGVLTSVMVGTKIVAPNLWGWLADRSGKRLAVIRFGCLMALACFAGMFIVVPDPSKGLSQFALVIFLYSFFWNAVLAQFEVVTLQYLGNHPEHYSRIRLWGSVGFIVAVACFGWLFDRLGMQVFPLLVAMGLFAILASSWLVRDPAAGSSQGQSGFQEGGFVSRLSNPPVVAFFAVCFLMVFSHGSYYTFFSLLLEHYHHSRTTIGLLWGLGVVAEVILFWFMHRLLPCCGVRLLLLASLLLTTVRWLVLAWWPDLLVLVVLAQCLHAFSFGAFHAAAIEAVRRLFTVSQAGKAQALYSAVGYGAGNAAGSLLAGWLWEWNTVLPFLVSAAVCLVGFTLAWRCLPRDFLGD